MTTWLAPELLHVAVKLEHSFVLLPGLCSLYSNSAPAPPTTSLTLAFELPQIESVQVFVKSLD